MELAPGPVVILNDTFGALACGLQAYEPLCVSDSYLSQLATRHNLSLNGFTPESVVLQDSLTALPDAPSLVVIKVPKTLAMLEHQLRMLRSVVATHTRIIAGAKARDIHTSTLQLFEKIIGPTRTSLAWKKARMIHCDVAQINIGVYSPTFEWELEGYGYRIHNHANVFSRGSLDIGTRFFMQHLPRDIDGKMVDLGCGNGIVGLVALAQNPSALVSFIDESHMALASSRMNVEINCPQDLPRASFVVNNSLANIAPDSLQAVLCNPPFHQQQTITDHLAWNMFSDARRCLAHGGELRIVGNRHLNYYPKLKHLFGNCEQLAGNNKFVVLRAVKLASSR
uniref:Uncharacterized protein n=1 Tax=Bracon brevicornis TaxID=1563983 RepID=A0A6V7JQ96_9HYME